MDGKPHYSGLLTKVSGGVSGGAMPSNHCLPAARRQNVVPAAALSRWRATVGDDLWSIRVSESVNKKRGVK